MPGIVKRILTRDEAGIALDSLTAWTAERHIDNPVHPGDVGWHLRFDATELADCLWLWESGGVPVAFGLNDGGMVRMAIDPAWQQDQALAVVLAAACATHERFDAPMDSLVRDELLAHGFELDDDPWPQLVCTDLPETVVGAQMVTEDDAADRVLVQRLAFERSTFTVQRWQQMRSSAAGDRCVEVLVRTPEGAPAAAATGWLAAPGRIGLLEPVGAHPDHRGHGYGRTAVRAACAALRQRGASAVAVLTPAHNVAAVRLYTSAGFVTTGRQLDLYRPSTTPA